MTAPVTQAGLTADVVERYEVMRSAVLGTTLPLMARRSLMLFLQRGMWGWASTPELMIPLPGESHRLSLLTTYSPHKASDIVYVLATIATGFH